ncbi:type IV pilin protein [Prochlorococcus marinus]|uniref:type IV pilin protein n=1 Tax=Prochlorococcus marinus TaxID=1219 RepID=UPI001ADBBCD8|nr:type II secretion system protein [Prochlorococcus marinus]MBO8204256.1 type II secretion system protein [Prochlorococcus marinus CUG1415]MBW3043557.1 hypothetical protein [Prochlorococcus marinus str. MU1415]
MIQYKLKKVYSYNSGFTLVELVVVIGALASLATFAIPGVLNTIKLSKAEEAKALMNAYASDCLGKYRISTDPVKFVNESVPDDIDSDKLETLGYKIDGNKSKCSHLAIKPLKDNDKFLYAFDFRISSEGKVLKTATPSDNPRSLNSCKGWAGKNCGLSEEQKAEFARLAAIAKAKSTCLSKYQDWLSKSSSGEYVSWDKKKETCTSKVWAFEGTPVSSAAAVEAALKAKYGQACAEWRANKRNNKNYISPNGNSETKNPECGGVPYWFHSGNEFTSKADWTEYDTKVKKQACESDRQNALSNKKKGKYVYGPTPGPSPCGQAVWLCNGEELTTLEAYKTTTCGAVPPPPPILPIPDPPKEVPGLRPGDPPVKCPGVKPRLCRSPKYKRLLPECKCWR